MVGHSPAIAILGASGVIGHAVATDLAQRGFSIVAVARKFTAAQRAVLAHAIEAPIVDASIEELTLSLAAQNVDIVINCIGVLQDGAHGDADEVHRGFVARLLAAMGAMKSPPLLMHVSIPGAEVEDRTPFSRTKREAESLIASSGISHVILRPGFVVAPAAYGGGALIRALAALPLALPNSVASRPFATVDIQDISRTIAVVAGRWRKGERQWSTAWDLMERQPTHVEGVIDAFRRRFGGPLAQVTLPAWLMDLGARCGDLAGRLGWSPPIRSTALQEMRRGVAGDPTSWIAATGIEPAALETALARLPATAQERWFARLFLIKPAIIAVLAIFWIVSGLIALTFAFPSANAILITHGVPASLARGATIVTSLIDFAVGCAIALRRTCARGLLVGVAVSSAYMIGGTILTPEFWVEPLGPLIKIAPAMLLMLVGLAILDERG